MSETTGTPDPYTDGSVPEDADFGTTPADDETDERETVEAGDDAGPVIPPIS